MTSTRRRRTGATETVGVSLTPETKRRLKQLAAARHQGNVSALIEEMTDDAVRQASVERAWRWYGGADLSDETRAAIDAELDEGWALARAHGVKRKRPPRTAA